jgi:REP element-mobilizing transposase RayT
MTRLQSRDTHFFVYLAWNTRDDSLLKRDQFRQAAHLAIRQRVRTQLCHLLAIQGTQDAIHMVVRLPASLPVSTLVRVSHDAAAGALTRLSRMLYGQELSEGALWSGEFTAHTLGAMDAEQAHAYVCRQIAEAA